MRSRRTPVLFAVLLLSLLPLHRAAAAPPSDPTLLQVESIVIEGIVSPAAREIAAAQSLLQPGKSYSEEELRRAVYRIRRLPFVLHADLTLRQGKEAGSTEVVIGVIPNRALFASLGVDGAYNADAEDGEDSTDWLVDATVGGRFFLGPLGLVSGSVEGFDGVGPAIARAGYTRYGLFGRGASASLSVETNVDRDDVTFYNSTFALEVPTFGDHSLRADVDWAHQKSDGFFYSRSDTYALGLGWIFDATDDPLFPTTGSRWNAGGRYSESRQRFRGFDGFSGPERETSKGYNLNASGRRNQALGERQSVFGEVSASWNRATLDRIDLHNEESFGAVRIGHAFDLLGRQPAGPLANLRWESSVEVDGNRFASDFGTSRSTDAKLTTGLALRNDWGLLRLTVSYVDNLSRSFRVAGDRL